MLDNMPIVLARLTIHLATRGVNRICEQRRKDGVNGLAIQYGPIGDVGVFENTDQLISVTTLQKQRINSCCDVLDKLLAVKQPIVTSFVSLFNKLFK